MLLNIDQRRIVDSDVTGDMLIRGVAGSGKTTVAVARIPVLLDYHCKEDDRILLLTYNRSLIHYVSYLYSKMDRQTSLLEFESNNEERLFIKTVDSVIFNLFRKLRIDHHKKNPVPSPKVQYDTVKYIIHKLQPKYKDIPWFKEENAKFFLSEIDWIKACGYNSVESYQEVSRSGRAAKGKTDGPQTIRRNSRQREAIYEVLQLYNEQMYDKGLFDFSDMARLVKEHFDLLNPPKYTHILVDEAQDLSKVQLDVIRLLYDDKDYSSAIFITDTSQSIYEKSWLSYNPFTSIGFNMHGRSRILSKNYRTTKQVAMAAYSLTEKDSAITDNELYVKPMFVEREGTFPVYKHFEKDEDELAYLAEKIKKQGMKFDLKDIVVLAKNKKQIEAAKDYLVQHGIDSVLYTDKVDFDVDKVKLFTMHSIKGLEFKCIFIIGLNDGVIPYVSHCEADDPAHAEAQDRKLLYVGMTRAEDRLFMSSSGKPSKFIEQINPEYLLGDDEEAFEHMVRLPESKYLFKDKLIDLHTKEESVRQAVLMKLKDNLGYPLECMDIEVPVSQYSRKGYADIVLYKDRSKEKALAVIECKSPGQDLGQHVDQLSDYMKALPGVRFGMLTNGKDHQFYERYQGKMMDRVKFPSYENLVSTTDKVYIYKNLANQREYLYTVSGYDNMNITVKYLDDEGLLPISDFRNVAIHGKVSAGLLRTISNDTDESSRYIPIPAEWLQKDHQYMMLKADGDSMLGAGISPKDFVVVRMQKKVDNYDIAVVIVNEEASMKKFIHMGEQVMLVPENPKYEPMMVPSDQVHIAGKVVGILQVGV